LLERIRSSLIKKILESDPDRQKRIINRLVKDPKKNKNKELKKRLDYDKNGKWTKELIIDTLSRAAEENGKLSATLLKSLREKDPQNYPAPSTVVSRFGSWEKAKKAVGGKAYPVNLNILKDFTVRDVNYFLNIYHQGNVKTTRDYHYVRRKYPESVPSFSLLIDIFGSFSNFKRVAEIDSCRDQLDNLLNLSIKLDKFPSKAKCKSENIDIDYLIERFSSLLELKGFILDLKSATEEIEKRKKSRSG